MAEVIGIGSLLADQVIKVDDDFLEGIHGKKGGMEYVAPETIAKWVELSGNDPKVTPGGSAANVIRGLACFGHDCALISKLGCDALAKELYDDLRSSNILLWGAQTEQPTGRALSIVTPDGQRTMRAFLGASGKWNPDELEPDLFHGSRLVHIEGYTLTHPGFTERAMAHAKQAGALVSLDLASFEVTARHKDEIITLIAEYVDIIRQ